MIKNFFVIAYRNLVKNKATSFLNISGLAIGVVVCLLIGIWLQRELSFDNFHPNGKEIFRIANTFKSESETFSQAPSGIALGAHLTEELTSLKAACRVFRFEYKFKAGENQFFEPNTLVVDSNFFHFFGFQLKKGDPRQVLSKPEQVVLSENAAIKYFGNVNDAMGKTMTMDDLPMTVAGVAENSPANSHLQYDIIIPYSNFRNWAIQNWQQDLDSQWVGGWPYVYVQLKDVSKWRNTEKEINSVVARFSEKEWKANKMSYHYFLQPVSDIHLRSHLRYDAANNGSLSTVNIFSIVGIIVLLLACINYVNLTTAGAIKRAKETSVRKVVGATKLQLVRQFFLETVVICAIAVIIGILLFKAILPAFSTWIGQSYYFPFTIKVLAIIAAFIIIISAVSGIYPAAILSSFNPAVSLKGSFSQTKRGNIFRKSLVVFQFTITIALVASILIISRQMNFIRNKSLGFNDNAVLSINFNGETKVLEQYASLRNELLTSPYILNVSKHNANVVGGLGNGWTTTQNLKGEDVSSSIYRLSVDADYFDTYGMKLSAGRFFSKEIPADSTKAVLVNEAAVKMFGWQKPENAIGKPFGKGEDARYVIGVVRDFNFENLHKPVEALLIGYVRKLRGNGISLKIDSRHTGEAINHLTKAWKNVIADVPLQFAFVDESVNQQYQSEEKMQGVFYGFSALSLLIACLGLFGLSTFVVERKIKEIGIRKVLGASISGIVGLLSGDFLKLVLIAAIIATPLAWYFMNSWLQDFAYRINIGWWVFAASGFIALIIALLTISFRAVRAALANPVKSLRTE